MPSRSVRLRTRICLFPDETFFVFTRIITKGFIPFTEGGIKFLGIGIIRIELLKKC